MHAREKQPPLPLNVDTTPRRRPVALRQQPTARELTLGDSAQAAMLSKCRTRPFSTSRRSTHLLNPLKSQTVQMPQSSQSQSWADGTVHHLLAASLSKRQTQMVSPLTTWHSTSTSRLPDAKSKSSGQKVQPLRLHPFNGAWRTQDPR